AAQIALSLVLLSGATLLIRSLLQLQIVDPGFEPQQVVTMRLTLAGPAYESAAERIQFWQTLLSRVDGLPGIEAQGLVGSLPLSGNFSTSLFTAEGHEVPEGQQLSAQLYPTAGDYLRAMQIPLLRGRDFTPAEQWDSAARVVLVNETVAERIWPDADPIGKRIRVGSDANGPWYTVIGVVGNVRHAGLANDWTRNQIYFPYGSRARGGISLVARTPMNPMAAASAIRQAIASVDPNLPVFQVRTMGEIYRQSLWEERLNGWLFGSFAVGAFVLAIVGVYGVMAHIVSQRTHEMGVRIALGASARQVSRIIIRRALVLALGGVAVGIVGALATTRLLAGMLYGVQPTDPVTFISVPLVLTTAALLASYLPARRATRVDPIVALRAE
ncbi:MAG TPA: FtsX-like permease family protein, partial [Chloroflexota bacterium]|nr:FtsX-like permease family protein [Chloroflexota bacterium]